MSGDSSPLFCIFALGKEFHIKQSLTLEVFQVQNRIQPNLVEIPHLLHWKSAEIHVFSAFEPQFHAGTWRKAWKILVSLGRHWLWNVSVTLTPFKQKFVNANFSNCSQCAMCKKHHTSVICPNSHQFILVIFSDVQTENLHQRLALQLSVCLSLQSAALIYNGGDNLERCMPAQLCTTQSYTAAFLSVKLYGGLHRF